jgi:hypothetical protein
MNGIWKELGWINGGSGTVSILHLDDSREFWFAILYVAPARTDAASCEDLGADQAQKDRSMI